MTRRIALIALCLVIAAPMFAQKKEAERLANSATVLREVLAEDLPESIVDKSVCILVFPGVKKVAIGIGGSYGRGALVCRNGAEMNGSWGPQRCISWIRGALASNLVPQ